MLVFSLILTNRISIESCISKLSNVSKCLFCHVNLWSYIQFCRYNWKISFHKFRKSMFFTQHLYLDIQTCKINWFWFFYRKYMLITSTSRRYQNEAFLINIEKYDVLKSMTKQNCWETPLKIVQIGIFAKTIIGLLLFDSEGQQTNYFNYLMQN